MNLWYSLAMSHLQPEEIITRDTYDATASVWSSAHNQSDFWAGEMQRFHELLPGGHILEVGAGGGRDAKMLVELGYKYVGTDVSAGLLNVARTNLPQETFVEKSVYDLDLPQAPFDGFWASAVLLHIPRSRIDEALMRIRSQMKLRAIGFISIKDGTTDGLETDIINGNELQRFFCRWSKDDFQQELERNSFQVVDYSFRPMSERTKWHCFFVEVAEALN